MARWGEPRSCARPSLSLSFEFAHASQEWSLSSSRLPWTATDATFRPPATGVLNSRRRYDAVEPLLCVLMREPRVRRSLCCCAASMSCVPRRGKRSSLRLLDLIWRTRIGCWVDSTSPINKETVDQPALACENPSALFYLLVKISVSTIYRGSPKHRFS
jgi:hypothetical protein